MGVPSRHGVSTSTVWLVPEYPASVYSTTPVLLPSRIDAAVLSRVTSALVSAARLGVSTAKTAALPW
jgi:hypothetical protein